MHLKPKHLLSSEGGQRLLVTMIQLSEETKGWPRWESAEWSSTPNCRWVTTWTICWPHVPRPFTPCECSGPWPKAVLFNPHAARRLISCGLPVLAKFVRNNIMRKKSSKRQNLTWNLTISTQIKFFKFIKYMVLNSQVRENVM